MVSESDMAINEAERPSRTRLSRNIDGAREEKLRSLKASNSAYRGDITRAQKRIEQLMTDRSNYEEVQVEKASLNKTFMSYSKCCQDINDCLCEDEVTELREIAKGYTNVCNAKEHLDRKLGEWIAIADVDLKNNFKERFEPSELTRGGSRGRQISRATEVKTAYLKKCYLQLSAVASRSSY
jgi:hypothetical protein